VSTPAPTQHLAAPDPDAVDAVAVLMRQVAEGSLTGAGLADRAAQRCAEVFAYCDGPTDPLWPVHVEITRAVLGFGGLPAAELAQWLAVARQRENPDAATIPPPAPASAVSVDDSDHYGAVADDLTSDTGTETETVAAEVDSVDTTAQEDSLADVPRDVLAEAEAAAWSVITRWRRDQQEAGTP